MKWLFDKFGKQGEKTAIICSDRIYSYSQLRAETERCCNLLESKKIGAGDCIALFGGFGFENTAMFLAAASRQCIIIPLLEMKMYNDHNALYHDSYARYSLNYTGQGWDIENISSGRPSHPLINRLSGSGDAGLILFSSGTTGIPKIILHNLTGIINALESARFKSLNSMVMMGFDHIGGIDTMMRLLSVGATLTIPDSRQPEEICRVIEKYKVEVLPATPSFLNLLILSDAGHKYDLSSLKIIGYGAESMPDTLLEKLKTMFPGVSFQQKFGTSETNAIRIFNQANDEQYFKINDQNAEIKIVDNELWIKNKTSFLGYLNIENPADNQWVNTGDIVEVRPDGFMRIIGRKKEMINVGGEKALPSEIEDVILRHPRVADCMVFSVPNAILGNVAEARVVINDTDDLKTVKTEIMELCKNNLPRYKWPVKIHFVDMIETNERQKKVRRIEK